MPAAISADKRDDIYRRLAAGEKPAAIAAAVGVDRKTVRNYVRKITEAGGLPAVQPRQVANIPAAVAYVQGDDHAVNDLLGLMDLRNQAQTMDILVRARQRYEAGRSVDVGVFADYLRYSLDILAGLAGVQSPLIDDWADAMNQYMHGNHPKVVDKLTRAGLM